MANATALALALLLAAGCAPAPGRLERPAMKGMELYSWKPAGGDWHFSLLFGTNSLKSPEEATRPETAIVGAAALKTRLSGLAKGEYLFWRNLAGEELPEPLAADIRSACERLQIKLERIDQVSPQ